MFHYGRISILGIDPDSLSDDAYSFLFESGVINQLESYKERLDRLANEPMTPERAFKLVYDTYQGTEQEKINAAQKAQLKIESK